MKDLIIRYVYDINDFVCNQLEASVNENARESYALSPTSFMILDPDSELFMPDDYPERFAEWFLEMVEITKKSLTMNRITKHVTRAMRPAAALIA